MTLFARWLLVAAVLAGVGGAVAALDPAGIDLAPPPN